MINSEYYNIEKNELNHWWYKFLHYLVYSKIIKYKQDKHIKILDAGCGTGGLMLFLQSKGFNNIFGVELSDLACNICKERNLNVIKSNITDIHNDFQFNNTDIIICNDILYFLNKNEQKNIIQNLGNILNKDGLIIINLPAFKSFRGIHDLSVSISERFTKKSFFKSFNCSGFLCAEVFYNYFLISALIFIKRYFQRCKMLINKNFKIKSDLKPIPDFLNNFLFQINKFENSYIRIKPFGSSLFIVLLKKD